MQIRIRIQLITLMRIRILPFYLMRIRIRYTGAGSLAVISCIGPTKFSVKIFQLLLAIDRCQDSSQLKWDTGNLFRLWENKLQFDFFLTIEKMHSAYSPNTPVKLSFRPMLVQVN